MWTATSGATAQSQSLDVIANNLANSETTGFKKDLPTFKEYLATRERNPEPKDIPQGQIKDRDLYPLDGRDQSFVVVDGTYAGFQQGPIRVTQRPLDIAIDGPGFFEISTPSGIRFTRAGNFKLSPEGRLVTSQGYPVLAEQAAGIGGASASGGPGPQDVSSRFINLSDYGSPISFTEEGEIYAGDDRVAKLGISEFGNLQKLRKVGNQLFLNSDPSNKKSALESQLRQGALEGSNVNPVEEITHMIRANRLFEQDLKALKTYGEMMGKEANDIGKL